MLWIIFRIGHCDPEDVDLNDLLLPEQGRRRRYHPTSPHRQTCSQVQGGEFIKEKSKKTRKHALVQENTHSPKTRGRFLGRVRVLLSEFFFSWTCACFLDRLLFFLTEFFFRGRVHGYFLVHFLFFFYKFSAQSSP